MLWLRLVIAVGFPYRCWFLVVILNLAGAFALSGRPAISISVAHRGVKQLLADPTKHRFQIPMNLSRLSCCYRSLVPVPISVARGALGSSYKGGSTKQFVFR